MGLLNLFKRKKVNQYSNIPPIPKSKSVSQEKKSNFPIPELKRQFLKDFFKVDITSILPEEGETRIILTEPELGNFNYIDFHFPSDGSINMEFLTLSKQFSPEFEKFIAACVDTFGPTKFGETYITNNDRLLLLRGLNFSRLWKDVWVDVGPDHESGLSMLRLTIFNVAKNSYIEMH